VSTQTRIWARRVRLSHEEDSVAYWGLDKRGNDTLGQEERRSTLGGEGLSEASCRGGDSAGVWEGLKGLGDSGVNKNLLRVSGKGEVM